MDEPQLPEAIRMLIKRMDTNPEEFINEQWDPIVRDVWDTEPFRDVRWSNYIRAMFSTGKELIFTEEEIEIFKTKYREILRTRLEECIVRELVGGERQKELDFGERQLDLPYTTMTTNMSTGNTILTTADMIRISAALENTKNKGTLK